MALCDQFTMYCADKINWIQTDLNSGFQVQSLDTPKALSGLILWDECKLMPPDDVNRPDGALWPTSNIIDPL